MKTDQEPINYPELSQKVRQASQDPKAKVWLYEQFYTRVYRFLYAYCGNQQDAEDLSAETFISAFKALPALRDPGSFSSWLFKIARNQAHSLFRKNKSSASLDQFEEQSAEQTHPGLDDQMLIRQLIGRLQKAERELLLLKLFAGLSFPELAELLKEPESRIKKRYYRLLDRLQSQVED